jgi:hypothetical protein
MLDKEMPRGPESFRESGRPADASALALRFASRSGYSGSDETFANGKRRPQDRRAFA